MNRVKRTIAALVLAIALAPVVGMAQQQLCPCLYVQWACTNYIFWFPFSFYTTTNSFVNNLDYGQVDDIQYVRCEVDSFWYQ